MHSVSLPESTVPPSSSTVQSENLVCSQELGCAVSPLDSVPIHPGVCTPAVEIALAPHIIAALSAGAFTFVVEGGVLKAVPVTPSERIVPSSVSVMLTLTSPAPAAPENSMRTPACHAPAPCLPQNTPIPEASSQVSTKDNAGGPENSDADDESSSNEGTSESRKGRRVGSAHKNESIGKYSFWVRISFCEDVRVGEMPLKEALKKWNAPRRRAREWLNQYDTGKYAGLTTVYTQEELKRNTTL